MPLGTVVINEETGQTVAEITEDGQQVVLCKGGNGGWGNTRFKTSTNRAPRKPIPASPASAACSASC
jgi:GTP-binding protein